MINWVFNKNAKTLFDESIVDEIRPIDRYPIWEKTDPYGRKYYGVANFCGVGGPASEDDDLSWLEWDGNENTKPREFLQKMGIEIIQQKTI